MHSSAFRGTLLDGDPQETWIITADSRWDLARRRKATEKLRLLFCDDFLYLHSSSGKATHDAKPIEAALLLEMSENENRANTQLAAVLLLRYHCKDPTQSHSEVLRTYKPRALGDMFQSIQIQLGGHVSAHTASAADT